jgi:predicted nucleotidyltransferase
LERSAALSGRYEKACADFRMIAAMVVERYNPKRVWQWGSLLDKTSFAEYSDIDMAVEGIPGAETFFALMGDAMKLTDFSLDIVQMEKIEPEFSELIRSKGKVIYERLTWQYSIIKETRRFPRARLSQVTR